MQNIKNVIKITLAWALGLALVVWVGVIGYAWLTDEFLSIARCLGKIIKLIGETAGDSAKYLLAIAPAVVGMKKIYTYLKTNDNEVVSKKDEA